MARLMTAFALVAGINAASAASKVLAQDGDAAQVENVPDASGSPPNAEGIKVVIPPGPLNSKFSDGTVNTPAAQSRTFDPAQAQEFLAYSRLPMDYEQMLLDGGKPDAARELLAKNMPEGVDLTVIRDENSTAVVTFDKAKCLVRVAYDPTTEPADKKDNARFWREDSPIGGRIHHGFYGAILKESPDGQQLVDQVRQQVEDYAKESGKPVTVDLTGFSKGGSMAIATAVQWMADGFANGTDGITMKNVYTLANPAVGDEKLCTKFAERAKAAGVNVTRVVAGNDAVPHILTAESPWYMPDLYSQAGDVYYLGADKNGNMRALHNPDPKAVETFRDQSADKVWHSPDTYLDAIKGYVTAGIPMTEPATAGATIRTAGAPMKPNYR